MAEQSLSAKEPVDLVIDLRMDLEHSKPKKASYGIDSPLGLVASAFASPLYLYATLAGKSNFWDRELSQLDSSVFSGNSLDAGCGRGLVLIKVAKRKSNLAAKEHRSSTPGRAYGIDIFNSRDQSGNSPQATVSNILAEDVQDIVKLHRASFCDLPFEDDYFQLVTSSLALHNPPRIEDRVKAIKELVRVTQPGGKILLLDLAGSRQTALYERVLREEVGSTNVQRDFAGKGVMFGMWYCEVIRATRPLR